MLRILFALLLVPSLTNAMELTKFKKHKINKEHIFATSNMELFKTKKGFQVIKDGKKKAVKSYDIDAILKSIPTDKLDVFLDNGYIEIKELSNGDFKLNAKGRINGGGPILAGIVYWGTKAVGYGVPAAAAGAIIATTAGAAVPALAAGGAAGVSGVIANGAAATLTTAIGAGLPASATAGATIVGSAVVGGIGVETAAIASTAAITSTGIAGYVAGVETAAATLAGLAMMVPFI